MPQKIAPGYLTVSQAAERIGVTPVWIYKLINTKVLTPYKQGVIVIKETELQKLEVPQEIITDENSQETNT